MTNDFTPGCFLGMNPAVNNTWLCNMMHQNGRTLDSHPTVLENFHCFPHTGEPFAGDNQVDLPSVPGVGPSILVHSCSHNAKEAQWKRNTLVVFIGNMSMDWGRVIFNQRFTLSLIFCHWHVSFKNDKLENHEMKKGGGLTLAMCLLWLILIQIVCYHPRCESTLETHKRKQLTDACDTPTPQEPSRGWDDDLRILAKDFLQELM